MSCGGVVLTNVSAAYSSTVPPPGTTRVTTFAKVCPAGTGISGNVSIYKNVSGATEIYASGFNSCNVAEPKRIERALKAKY